MCIYINVYAYYIFNIRANSLTRNDNHRLVRRPSRQIRPSAVDYSVPSTCPRTRYTIHTRRRVQAITNVGTRPNKSEFKTDATSRWVRQTLFRHEPTVLKYFKTNRCRILRYIIVALWHILYRRHILFTAYVFLRRTPYGQREIRTAQHVIPTYTGRPPREGVLSLWRDDTRYSTNLYGAVARRFKVQTVCSSTILSCDYTCAMS